MTTQPLQIDSADGFADQAAKSVDRAVHSTKRLASDAVDELSNAAHDVREELAPLLSRATDKVSDAAHKGMASAREASQQLREGAQRATDSTLGYVKQEPLKAMLIAAAVGAALMGIVSLVGAARR